jgi:outer membrane receptor protein involved in Fe transport
MALESTCVRRIFRRVPLRRALLALLPLLPLGAAPAPTGTVAGTVLNQATGELLVGAAVEIEGTGVSGVSERGGAFSIEAPAGQRTLVVSYSGLDPVRLSVLVTAGQVTTREVAMTAKIYQLEKFTVSGEREGSARAIQAQRQAANPLWVVATDTFGNPAANPGELIQRLPGISTDIVGSEVRTIYVRGMGPGFSALMVDGERIATSTGTSASRDYQIEQMGTGNLETVELIKAPQPEQDANAVAGFINLVSRRAFDAAGRRVTVTAGTMWRRRGFDGSPFRDRPEGLDLLSVGYSDVYSVFGGSRNLGLAFNLNRRVSATTQDEVGPGGVLYNFGQTYLNPNTANPLTRVFGTGDFGYKARAHNAGLNLDYKLSPDAYVFAKLGFNTNDQYQEYYRPGIGNPAATAANFAAGSTYEHSFLLPHAASIAISEATPAFTKNSRNYSFTGGTEFKFLQGSATASLRASYSHADISYPGWIRAQARTPATAASGIGFELDRRGQDPWYPIFRQTAGPSVFDPASYVMTSMQKQSYKAGNDLYGLRADGTKRFTGRWPVVAKAGVKWAEDTRNPFTDFGCADLGGRRRRAELGRRRDDAVCGPPVQPGRRPLRAVSVHDEAARGAGGLLAADRGGRLQQLRDLADGALAVPRDHHGGVLAGRDEVRPVARARRGADGGDGDGGPGLGAEHVRLVGRQQRRRHQPGPRGGGGECGARAALVRAAEHHRRRVPEFFPGLHFVYELLPGLLGRASYNRAISRPPVANLIPTLTENHENSTVTAGNPDLKPYLTDNFEVSLEKYFEPVGQVSVSAFAKDISNYFRSFASTIPAEGLDGSGLYAGYTLSQVRNIGTARIRGLELSYQQQYSFLPGIWRGLGFFANFTYLKAEGDFGTTATTTKLGNLAPRSGNTGLSFRHRGLDVRLLANWTDQKYKSVVSGIDVYAESRLGLDLKLQYSVNRRYSVFLDCTNLTDEAARTDVSLNGLKFFKTNQGVGFVAGVRGNF